jgi:hypothetical protein
MKPTKPIAYLAVFVAGFIVSSLWQSLKSSFYWRPVQYLQDSTRTHKAVLERIDGIDLNFRIKLNGKQTYWSPDFAPRRDIAFRETLLWDDSGNILIFEVGSRRIFGYNVAQGQALSNAALLKVKVSPLPVNKHRFEGQWPSQSGS